MPWEALVGAVYVCVCHFNSLTTSGHACQENTQGSFTQQSWPSPSSTPKDCRDILWGYLRPHFHLHFPLVLSQFWRHRPRYSTEKGTRPWPGGCYRPLLPNIHKQKYSLFCVPSLLHPACLNLRTCWAEIIWFVWSNQARPIAKHTDHIDPAFPSERFDFFPREALID